MTHFLQGFRRLLLPLLVAGALSPSSPLASPVTVLNAAAVLPAEMLEGPNFWVDPEVRNDGLVNTYRVKTKYGTLEIEGSPLLFERIGELRGLDQIEKLVHGLKTNPNSRRHIVTAWNPADVDDMALPPCHCLFQFFVADGKLSCQLYQRSADVFLGVPFNIASYALLTMMMAQVVGLEPGEFIHTFGDAHLYLNHLEQAELQLTREPLPLPTMTIAPREDLFTYQLSDFVLNNYAPWPHIKAAVAV